MQSNSCRVAHMVQATRRLALAAADARRLCSRIGQVDVQRSLLWHMAKSSGMQSSWSIMVTAG